MQTQTSESRDIDQASDGINQALQSAEPGSDAFEPRPLSAPRRRVNLGTRERAASVAAGAGLLVYSLSHPLRLRRAPIALAGAALLHRGATGHCYGYGALGISTAASSEGSERPRPELRLVRSVTIAKDRAEVFRLWQEPGMLEQILQPVAELERSEQRITWRIRGPLEHVFEFRTRVVLGDESDGVRWVPEDGQDHELRGSLRLERAPRDLGTEATLHLTFAVPGGQFAKAVLELLGPAPKLLVDKALRRLKAMAETGEIPTLENNPAARSGRPE